jgi:hypothetical protein
VIDAAIAPRPFPPNDSPSAVRRKSSLSRRFVLVAFRACRKKPFRNAASGSRPATFGGELRRLDASIEDAGHFFICCFGTDGDDLGQWRSYAEDGHGFALGFDTGALEEAFMKSKGKRIGQQWSFRITYDDMELTQIQAALVDLVDQLTSLPRTTASPRP